MVDFPSRSTRFAYPPVGRCIYCGREDGVLTMEHIIPESLGGILELPEASCGECQKIINRYEGVVARNIFGDFRIRHNMRSKRPKRRRPETIELEFHKDGQSYKKAISRDEWPAPIFMYKFGQASILRGLQPGSGAFEWDIYVLSSIEEMNELSSKYGDVSFLKKVVPIELARVVAKIGYSYSIAEMGLGTFTPVPEHLDTILCKTDDVGYTVGGDKEIRPPLPELDHVVRGRIFFRAPQPPFLIVDIRLFASLYAPTFHAVVGTFDLQNPQQLRTFTEKVDSGKPVKVL